WLLAVEAAGDLRAVDELVALSAGADARAPLAADVVASLVGLDLRRDKLALARTPREPRRDAHPDDDLPWPDAAALARWWAAHRHRFDPRQRWLAGRPRQADHLQHVLRHGRQ